MSTLEELKEYLIGADGYLLNPDNNGKTVMLSGAWGSGKTHFWQNEIVKKQYKIGRRNKYPRDEYKTGLFSKLVKKKKACVYISLYGKDNIEDIKSQVFTKAYAQIPKKGNKDKNIDTAVEWLGYGSKIASAVSLFSVKIDTTQITDKAKDYQDNEKLRQAQESIRNGGVICFDDFERKSKNIDLNDLFGVMSQLSLEFNCKVIIILNSDVFKGEEANVFKNVKEKTVNKFFKFQPSVSELFNLIYISNKKYKLIYEHKEEILTIIEETEILNARAYIQILDNCIEWSTKGYSFEYIRVLVLASMNFILNHNILSYTERVEYKIQQSFQKLFTKFLKAPLGIFNFHDIDLVEVMGPSYDKFTRTYKELNEISEIIINAMSILSMSLKKSTSATMTIDESFIFLYTFVNEIVGEEKRSYILSEFKENEALLKSVWKYGYMLDIMENINEIEYIAIIKFVETGILLKKDKEPSS